MFEWVRIVSAGCRIVKIGFSELSMQTSGKTCGAIAENCPEIAYNVNTVLGAGHEVLATGSLGFDQRASKI
ncbi:MAG: hypothetical protein JNN04_13800 [Cyclobacteriaceae bacterium]|nr:hypothetical protein [Cyclobacteriaceae bacterium]